VFWSKGFGLRVVNFVHKGELVEGLRRSILSSQFLTKNSRLGELFLACVNFMICVWYCAIVISIENWIVWIRDFIMHDVYELGWLLSVEKPFRWLVLRGELRVFECWRFSGDWMLEFWYFWWVEIMLLMLLAISLC